MDSGKILRTFYQYNTQYTHIVYQIDHLLKTIFPIENLRYFCNNDCINYTYICK